ncbi:MAG: helix-turn-helix domain-containing protein, partial [Solirubrobacteraceae bacterium]
HPLLAAALSRLSDPGLSTTREIGVEIGWTQRRVEQVFRSEVGLAPGGFRRLQRFRACLRAIDRAAKVGWSTFALEHGYCDQSHLIREFRSHCGLSPSAYMRARGPALNHVPLTS